ncbi:MAG TPA: oligosaccharide flippase family protein [Longimicrobium sp.]|nr:oligosaccharide flippase family protein [Longimicrobium sp.]
MSADSSAAALAPAPAAGLGERLRRALSWNLAAAVLGQGATFLTALLLANVLGKAVFGRYAIVQSALVTLTQVASLATGYTATRFVAELRVKDPARAGRILWLCGAVSTAAAGVAGVGLALGSRWIAATLLEAPELATGLVLVAPAVFFAVQSGFQTGALAGLEAYRPLAGAAALGAAATVGGSVLLAGRFGLHGAFAGLTLGAAIQWAALKVVLHRESRRAGVIPSREGLSAERRVLTRFALPAAMSGVSLPVTWLASAVLARQPGGFSQVAIFSAATTLRVLVVFLPNLMNGVALSLISSQMGAGDGARYRRMFWLNVRLTAAAALAGALGLVALGPHLLALFGAGFGREGYPVLLVLLVGALAEAVGGAAYQVVQTKDRLWHSFFFVVGLRSVVLLSLAYALAPRWGAVGLAIAVSAGFVTAFVSTLVLAWRLGLDLPARAPDGA